MLQRMLIDKMENRILVGIVMFLGTMLLVGWVAINENARMASFDRQFTARSIERGADLFAANCSTCHGENGLGINGRGPALNSPHFFGFDYFAEIDRQMLSLQTEQRELETELVDLAQELVSVQTGDARATDIEERLTEINERLSGEDSIAVEMAALNEERTALAQQLLPAAQTASYPLAINSDGTLDYEPTRLGQIEFGSTLEDYIISTLVHGRPGSNAIWPEAMVSWSNQAGGQMRDDQLQDLANYILNWNMGEDWTIEDALAVQQYALVPVNPLLAGTTGGEEAEPAGTDVEAITAAVMELEGDAARGEQIYSNQGPSQLGSLLACSGCHLGGIAAPDTSEQWVTVNNERLALPQFEGYSAEQYIVESIVNPGAYLAPGYGNAMPGDFGTRVSNQDIADVIAYVRTYSDSE